MVYLSRTVWSECFSRACNAWDSRDAHLVALNAASRAALARKWARCAS